MFNKIIALFNPINELGGIDSNALIIPIKGFLLNHIKENGFNVPEGMLVNLSSYYERLLEIFMGNQENLINFLKELSHKVKQPLEVPVSELLNSRFIPNSQIKALEQLLLDIDKDIMSIQAKYNGLPLILRGLDDDLTGQSGITNSMVLNNNNPLAVLYVLLGYLRYGEVLDREKNLSSIIPFDTVATEEFFTRNIMPHIQSSPKLALMQVVPEFQQSGTIIINNQYIVIEYSPVRHYHDKKDILINRIVYNKETGALETNDERIQALLPQLKGNILRIIASSKDAFETIKRVNPLFNSLELEVCLADIYAGDYIEPYIVQAKPRLIPKVANINPESGIFQLSDKHADEPFIGRVVLVKTPQDFAKLTPETIGLVCIEDWGNSNFPKVEDKNKPMLFLTNGGEQGQHIITRLKMLGCNCAKIPTDSFDELLKHNGSNVVVQRDYVSSAHGVFVWGLSNKQPKPIHESTLDSIDFQEVQYLKLLAAQRASGVTDEYRNSGARLVAFGSKMNPNSLSKDDPQTLYIPNEDDTEVLETYRGSYLETEHNGVVITILLLDRNRATWRYSVLDPSLLLRLTPENLLKYLFFSKSHFNLTICNGRINVCNYLSTHYILRGIHDDNTEAVRGSTVGNDGNLLIMDTWNGLTPDRFNPLQYKAEISDILNSLATLKNIVDIGFFLDYSQEDKFKLAQAMLSDSRFESRDILPLIGYVLVKGEINQEQVNVMIPFDVYKQCYELTSDLEKPVDDKLLWQTIMRYFNDMSISSGRSNSMFKPSSSWIREHTGGDTISPRLKNLVIIDFEPNNLLAKAQALHIINQFQ